MRKKLVSLLLAFAMVLSLCPAALAAEDGGVRETDFFTDQYHADVDFADMEYVHMEAEPFYEAMDAIRDLLEDKENAGEVEERFNDLMDEIMKLITMDTLIYIKSCKDAFDEEATEELEYTEDLSTNVVDALEALFRDILKSPCDAFLKEQLSEEDLEYYLAYEEMTQEEKDLVNLEDKLENEYWTLAASVESETAEYNGREWTDDDAYSAYAAGEISYEDYVDISRAIAKEQNAILGELYLRMVDVRKDIAKAEGFDTYTDYAYSEIFDRDYTKEEIRAFHQAVKDGGFYELYEDLYTLFLSGVESDIYYGSYAGDTALNMIEPYLGRMSSELAEALSYMREHGLYDSGYEENKRSTGYTTIISSYGAPFFFDSPYMMLYDFTTAVHEFGHYNNYYWHPNGWNDATVGHDQAEVHSQGMELLFSHWYPEIFSDSAQFVLDLQMSSLISAICEGALHDELQQFVYETENVTLEQINQKYRQLCGEYGIVDEDDERTEMYGWMDIHHTFDLPCYYISYAVSAAGAFAFWLETQESEYFDVLDEYLRFVALPAEMGFQESFEELGMDNPISPEFMAELAGALRTAMDVDARLEALEKEEISFSDVTEGDWFYDYVMFMAAMGIPGYEDGTFRPQEAATVGLLDEEAENAAEPILRGDLCRIIASDILEIAEMDALASPFSDTDDPAVTAMAALGIVNGYGDGAFRPDQPMTRAEFCAAFCRTLQLMMTGSLGGSAPGSASADEAA